MPVKTKQTVQPRQVNNIYQRCYYNKDDQPWKSMIERLVQKNRK